MTDKHTANAQPIAGLPHPGLISRARFFASRHPIAVSVPLAAIIAFGVATLAAFVLGVTPERREVFIPGVAAISLTAIGAVIFPLVARMHSIASGRDIAAALVAATDRERPHLLAEIEAALKPILARADDRIPACHDVPRGAAAPWGAGLSKAAVGTSSTGRAEQVDRAAGAVSVISVGRRGRISQSTGAFQKPYACLAISLELDKCSRHVRAVKARLPKVSRPGSNM